MAVGYRFKPEQFELDPRVSGFQLDQEVAAEIATTLYAADPMTRDGNNWGEPPIIVDPAGETVTHGVRYKAEANPEGDEGYRLSLEADEADSVNQLFAREMRTAFFDGECRHRAGWTGSLAMAGAVGAIFEGGPIYVAASTSLPALSKAEFIASGTIVAGFILKHVPGQLQRLRIIKPGTLLNERHLQSAEETAKNLKLPPVITPS